MFVFIFVVILFFLTFGLRVLFFFLRRKIFIEDVKRAIIEAELEIRKGNFDLK